MTWLEESRKVCEAATPGPYVSLNALPRPGYIVENAEVRVCDVHSAADATFIAHFNPVTVRKMLAVVEATKKYRDYERIGQDEGYLYWQEHWDVMMLALAELEES